MVGVMDVLCRRSFSFRLSSSPKSTRPDGWSGSTSTVNSDWLRMKASNIFI